VARAVALLSGGLDSGTGLAMWLARGGAVPLCLTFDYGQRSAVPERDAARALAERFGLAWQAVALDWLAAAARRTGCALVPDGAPLPRI
jgi:7-cyano-7-deazaguanine synthase